MEQVLDSEPLPLGHRETVRKYFESIGPTADESELVGAESAGYEYLLSATRGPACVCVREPD